MMVQRLAVEISRFEKPPLRVRVPKALYDQLQLETKDLMRWPADNPIEGLHIRGVLVEADDTLSLGSYDLDIR